MTTISPTRVSMYDFLYQDIQPLVSLLADTATLSLPQTRLAMTSSLQAIIGALLSYQQRYQGQAVNKRLFSRTAVKELRQYNAMNFATLEATLYHRHDVTETLFINSTSLNEACDYIADQIKATARQVKILLSNLTIIVLRELAILADYSQLDNEELDKWFALQPQFLSAERFASAQSVNLASSLSTNEFADTAVDTDINTLPNDTHTASDVAVITPPVFDHYWYKLNGFTPSTNVSRQEMQQATANYLKVIGRAEHNRQSGHHNDLLVFTQMPAITLPHQRWLLQLAKISDIYLSRNRLRITSEPDSAPTRPRVSLSLLASNSEDTLATTSETPIKYADPKPLWKNPVVLITILVIAVLGALAFIKYQIKQANNQDIITATVDDKSAVDRELQDIAIVKVDDAEVTATEKTPE